MRDIQYENVEGGLKLVVHPCLSDYSSLSHNKFSNMAGSESFTDPACVDAISNTRNKRVVYDLGVARSVTFD